ncbi:MAG: hypothetical protein RL610_1310 [Pseudomonadota bacterium]
MVRFYSLRSNIGWVTVARETSPEYYAGDGWAVMSKRFLRWIETWIEENIPPGANPDIESHEARAKRLTEKLFAEAAAANFTNFETEEERERVPPLVLAAVMDSTNFDIDAYHLKSQLAQENEDGD